MRTKDLKIGKWYKVRDISKTFYKFGGEIREDMQIRMLEYVSFGEVKTSTTATNCDFWEKAEEIEEEELRPFLPQNHPDLKKEIIVSIW